MPIIKRECLEDGFAQINNTLLQREDLAYDTKGLLCELLSRPDDWEVIKSQLIRGHTGLTKLNRMLKEAQDKGYMKVEQLRRPDGTIAQNIWFVASQPRYNVDEPKVVKPERRLTRTSVKPPLQIKTNTNKEKTINKEKDFEEFWKLYPRKVAKKKALESWVKIDFETNTAKEILQSLRRQRGSIDWSKDEGKWIPHPTTWLNQERWTDELAQVEPVRATMTEEQWIREEVPKFRHLLKNKAPTEVAEAL